MFDQLLSPITSGQLPIPVVIGAAILVLLAGVALLARFGFALPVLGAMLFFSSIAVAREYNGTIIRQWLNPLQEQRSLLYIGTGLLLAVSVFGHQRRIAGRPIPVQALLMFLIAAYAGFMRVIHEGPGSGVSSILFAAVVILPAVLVIGGLMDDWEDILRIVRTFAWTYVVWNAAVIVQLLANPGRLTVGRGERFTGLLGNPQHAAVFLGLGSAMTLWLVLNEPRRRQRFLWMAVLGLNTLLLIWTGSRTGAGVFAVGLAITAYGRLGRSMLLLPVAAILALVLVPLATRFGVDLSQAGRIGSLEDTRSGAWATLLDAVRESPWTGVGVGDTGRSENSYLYGLAAYGAGMGVLIVLLLGVSGTLVFKLYRIRSRCADMQRGLVDLAIAFNAMYFAGAVLEGYLMARVSGTLVLYLAFATLTSRLLWIARHDPDWLAMPLTVDGRPGDQDPDAWEDEDHLDEHGAWPELHHDHGEPPPAADYRPA